MTAPSRKPRTVEDAFGADTADALARWAIDALCDPPEKLTTYRTSIRSRLVTEGRKILDDAGIDWRAIKTTH